MRDYDFYNQSIYQANKIMSGSNPNKRWKPRSKARWLVAAVVIIVGIAVLLGAVKLLGVIRAGM